LIEGQDVVVMAFDILKADIGAEGFATLVGGRLFRDQVPQTAALPAALVSLVTHTDTNTMSGHRVFASTLIDLHLIGDGINYGTINPAGRRGDFILQGAGGAKNGTSAVKLRRESVQAYVENDNGKSYCHLVQSYRTETYA
jgi:hypothetical protein